LSLATVRQGSELVPRHDPLVEGLGLTGFDVGEIDKLLALDDIEQETATLMLPEDLVSKVAISRIWERRFHYCRGYRHSESAVNDHDPPHRSEYSEWRVRARARSRLGTLDHRGAAAV
jgi:hypothetical protein